MRATHEFQLCFYRSRREPTLPHRQHGEAHSAVINSRVVRRRRGRRQHKGSLACDRPSLVNDPPTCHNQNERHYAHQYLDASLRAPCPCLLFLYMGLLLSDLSQLRLALGACDLLAPAASP